MAAPRGSHRSLDRLKALDSLPDAQSQLETVKELCTHPARAEYILKWLLDTLKSPASLRSDPAVWSFLPLPMRLVSPDKLAILITSVNLIDTVKIVVRDGESNLREIAQVLELLFDLSDIASNIKLKAALSIPAEAAAELTGIWLWKCHGCYDALDGPRSKAQMLPLLDIAVKVWSNRMPSYEDDELFSRFCLPPVACILKCHSEELTHSSKRKRVVRSTPAPSNSPTLSLATALVRHVFLSARTAFFDAIAQIWSKEHRAVGSQRPDFVIIDRMQSLKMALSSSPDDAQTLQSESFQTRIETLPLLLDLALRCVHSPSPSLRAKEQPWNETVFETLLECNRTTAGELRSSSVLEKMVSTAGERHALSLEYLQKLLDLYGGLDQQGSDKVQWPLITAVMKVNPEVFANDRVARALFSAISSADAATRGNAATDSSSIDNAVQSGGVNEQRHATWRSDLLLPFAGVFGKLRRMPKFLDLWLNELCRNSWWTSTAHCIWDSFDDEIGELCESTLSESELREIARRSYGILVGKSDGDNATDALTRRAHAVILNSIISRATLDVALEGLNEILTVLKNDPSLNFLSRPSEWALVRRIFQIAYPSWVSEQQDGVQVGKTLHSILPFWLLFEATVIRFKSTLRTESIHFAACILSYAGPFWKDLEADAQELCFDALDKVVRGSLDGGDWEPVFLFPELIKWIEEDTFANAVASTIELETALHDSGTPRAIISLRSVLGVICEGQMTRELNCILRKCLDYVGMENRPWVDVSLLSYDLVVSRILTAIPPDAIPRDYRENILNALCKSEINRPSPRDVCMPHIYSLMIHLMQAPNHKAELVTNPSLLVNISKAADRFESSAAYKDICKLLGALVTLVIEQLLRIQPREQSRALLRQLSTEIRSVIDIIAASLDNGHRGVLTFVKVAIWQAEDPLGNDLEPDLPHRQRDAACLLLRGLMDEIDKQKFGAGRDGARGTLLALELLAALPETFTDIAAEVDVDLDPPMRSLPIDLLGCFSGNTVACLLYACRYAHNSWQGPGIARAIPALLRRTNPNEYAACLEAFEGFLKRMDPTTRMRATNVSLELLKDARGVALPSTVALLDCCTGTLQKDDFECEIECESGKKPPRIMQRVLEMTMRTSGLAANKRLLALIDRMVREKQFMINQYNVETTLLVIHNKAREITIGNVLFLDLCKVVNSLLLNHLNRLNGRFHILVRVLQALQANLFVPTKRTSRSRFRTLGPKHAHAFARLLTFLATPPQLRKATTRPSSFVDESRKQQAHVGRFVQPLLHDYCVQVLQGSLADGVREALHPGLWAILETMEICDAHGVKVLSSSMDHGERAILRGLYADWKSFGKWKGN